MQLVAGAEHGRDAVALSMLELLVLSCSSTVLSCSSASCGPHGVCEVTADRCLCQNGWGGVDCRTNLFPSCALRATTQADDLPVTCEGLRKLSPVACECLAECLRAGHEVCGPGSFGCQREWRAPQGLRHRTLKSNLTSREGFYDYLRCTAAPAGARAHSEVPPPPGSKLLSFAAFMAGASESEARRALLPPAPPALPAFGAGLRKASDFHEDARAGGVEPTPPPGSHFVADHLCGERGCSGRGRCLLVPDGAPVYDGNPPLTPGERVGATTLSGLLGIDDALGGTGGTARCICIDGAYGAACDATCSNNCWNDCSGRGECIHGWCRCLPGAGGVDCSIRLSAGTPSLMEGASLR
eukprot:1512762-Prymnesium_polylepis.1